MDARFICCPAEATDGTCKRVVVGVSSRVSLDAKRLGFLMAPHDVPEALVGIKVSTADHPNVAADTFQKITRITRITRFFVITRFNRPAASSSSFVSSRLTENRLFQKKTRLRSLGTAALPGTATAAQAPRRAATIAPTERFYFGMGCFPRLAAPPLLSHRAMHALNGNIDHPQRIDINAIPAKPFLPVIIEKIPPPRTHAPVPSSTSAADFEKELARANPASAASLQRDIIAPDKKSTKKNKKKPAPPATTANATVVHFNMNLGGTQSAVHFLRKFTKRYANQTLIVNLVETGLQTAEEAKSLTTFAAAIGFSSSHVVVSAEESNLIWKMRKMKKNESCDQPKTPRRGGISTFWNAPLKDPVIQKDDNHHWQTLTFSQNGKELQVIALYNNNTASLSDHPYDAQNGNQIIANEITPLVNKHTIILMDANQTKNDCTDRNPAKAKHTRNALNALLDDHDLADAVTYVTPATQFTYSKKHANGPVSSVIDYILVPVALTDEHRIHDAGLVPTNYQPALDDTPVAPNQDPSPDPVYSKYDPYSPHLPLFATLSLPIVPPGFTPPEPHPETEMQPNQPKNDEEQARFLALLNDRIVSDPLLARLIVPTISRNVLLATEDHLEQAKLLQSVLPAEIDCELANSRFESIFIEALVETCGVRAKMQTFHQKIHHDPKFYHLKIVKERALIALRNLKAHLRTDAPAGPFPSYSISNLKSSVKTMLQITKLAPDGWLDHHAYKSNRPIDLMMAIKALKGNLLFANSQRQAENR
jgi:hypothetical protein